MRMESPAGILDGRMVRAFPVGRLGQPAEVADLIVAVTRNAYMTGQTVSVDGGRYPR